MKVTGNAGLLMLIPMAPSPVGGFSRGTRSTVIEFDPRSRVTSVGLPRLSFTSADRVSRLATVWPSIFSMMSPTCKLAVAAGESLATLVTCTRLGSATPVRMMMKMISIVPNSKFMNGPPNRVNNFCQGFAAEKLPGSLTSPLSPFIRQNPPKGIQFRVKSVPAKRNSLPIRGG